MNDVPDPDRPAPRRSRTRIGLTVGAVLLLVAGAAVGGYLAGRSDPVEAAESCAEIRKTVFDMGAEVQAAESSETANLIRTQMTMVLQNPDCFPARVRADAQTAMGSADQQAAAKALCDASDHRWWEC